MSDDSAAFLGFERQTSRRIRHCFRKYFRVSLTGLGEMFVETRKEFKNLARLSLEPILRRSHILLRIWMKLAGNALQGQKWNPSP